MGANYQTPIGSRVFEETGGKEALASDPNMFLKNLQSVYGNRLAAKFPELDFLLRDPDSFTRTMESRFAR